MKVKPAFIPFYLRFYCQFLCLAGFATLIFSLSRLFLLSQFGNIGVLEHLKSQTIEAFLLGHIFDLKLVALLLSPFYLFSFVLALPWLAGLRESYLKFTLFISKALLFFFLFTAVTNYFYYLTFHSPFNDFMFAFFEGETQAVMGTIWQDYPIVVGPALIILAFYLLNQVMLFLLRSCELYFVRLSASIAELKKQKTLLLFVSFLLFFACARGSVTVLPLTRNWARVANTKILNDIIPNAPYSIFWAFRDHYKQQEVLPVTQQEGYELYHQFHQHFSKMEKANIDTWSPEAFYATTKKNSLLEKEPPLVVFNLMEGLGSHLQYFQSDSFDILAGLDRHFEQDYLFENFLSGGDGTFPSLIRMMLSSRQLNLPNTKYKRIEFQSSIARPFKDKGYEVYYLASGNSAWRNLHEFLPALGFDHIVDAVELKRAYPEAIPRTWGVDDEYVYKMALKILSEAQEKNKKVFLFIQTISNHPPYAVPETGAKIEIPQEVFNYFAGVSKVKVKTVLEAYRYGNYSFAQFLTNLKSSPLRNQTIVAATGDHNLRELKYKNLQDYAWWHKTPFYLYLPKKYRKPTVFEKSRFGSHRDVFPTIFHLSLSEAQYLDLGQNMLSSDFNKKRSLALGEIFAMNEQGAYYQNNLTSPWISSDYTLLDGKPSPIDGSDEIFKHISVYNRILDWLTAHQIHEQQ